MNETTATVETPKPRKAKKAKKAAKPAKAARPARLPKPCRQVLATLAKAQGPMTRREIADKVGKTETLIEGRIAAETKTYGFLTEAKLIKEHVVQVDEAMAPQTCYAILAAGRTALETALADAKAREKAKAKAKK
jgi:hypothetical protein